MFKKIASFFKKDLWETPFDELESWKKIVVKQIRIFFSSAAAFKKDHCGLRSSALTFFSLLSIVPVIAMLFAVAKGFGLEQMLEEQLGKAFSGQQEVIERIMTFAHNMLANAKGGVIAGVGVVVLLWSVMRVMGNIEGAFNAIWKITRGRSIFRKFTDYFAIILITPILLILSSGMTVFVVSKVEQITKQIELLGLFTPFILFMLKFLPYLFFWLLFMVMYMVMPNTRVKFGSALIAGIISGTVFQIVEWGYIKFQVGVSGYNAIYGSFAALPLFLFWMQISWNIVLFGAEYCFAHQYFDKYAAGNSHQTISYSQKQLLALLVTHRIVKSFIQNTPPMNVEILSEELKISRGTIRNMLEELVDCGILTRCLSPSSSGKQTALTDIFFQPAHHPDSLTIESVLQSLNQRGSSSLSFFDSEAKLRLSHFLSEIQKAVKNSEGNKILKDI